MNHGLRLVIGGRGRRRPVLEPPPPTPQHAEARVLVEAWLDHPACSVTDSVDDLVARIAALLAERDGRLGLGAPASASLTS